MRRHRSKWARRARTARQNHDEYLGSRKKASRDLKRLRLREINATRIAEARRRGVKHRLTAGDRRAKQRLTKLPAPDYLSLFGNMRETLAYCNRVRSSASRPNAEVYLDFKGVRRFTSDALLLVRAIMDECQRTGPSRRPATFSGNLPSNDSVATEFKATGFFQGFSHPPANLPAPKGTIRKYSRGVVDGDRATRLCRFAWEKSEIENKQLFFASRRTLVELMNNTHEHALAGRNTTNSKVRKDVPQPSSRPWYASVYCRDGSAYFNFLDFGVGIMGTAPVKRAAHRLQRRLGIQIASTRLLEEVFDGKAGSSTTKPGRGHGLPNMKRDANGAGGLLGLKVLTSDVFGTVADSQFDTLGESFRGTFYHWQVKRGEQDDYTQTDN